MRHEGSDKVALRSTVGRGAGLAVTENDRRGPAFATFRDFPAPDALPRAPLDSPAADPAPAAPILAAA